MYTDKLDHIVNKYNNTYHSTITIKPGDVKSSTYIDFGIGNNEKYPKFEVGQHVRISKCKNIFARVYTLQIGLKRFLWLTKLKIPFRGHLLLLIFTLEKLLEHWKVENVTKKKDSKLYFRWKCYNNCFNSWIDKKRYYYIKWIFSWIYF